MSQDTDNTNTDTIEIKRLAALTPMEYDRQRKQAARELNIRIEVLDKAVKEVRGEADNKSGQGQALLLPDPEPWPEPVDGAILLDELVNAIRRYVVMDKNEAIFHFHAKQQKCRSAHPGHCRICSAV